MIIRNADSLQAVGQGLDYIEAELKKHKLKPKQVYQSLLLVEETLLKLIQEAPVDSDINLEVKKRFGAISIKLSARGNPIQISGENAMGMILDTEDMEPDAEHAIRNMVLTTFRDSLKIRSQHGKNTVQILVQKSDQAQLYLTMGALLAAVVFGLVLRLAAPEVVQNVLNTYIFGSVKTVFLNALKMIVTPMVFFSIASCVAGIGDLREFGKLGGRVIGYYLFTALISLVLGLVLGLGVQVGQPGSMLPAADTVEVAPAEISIFQTILNIVPSNIVQPFLQADMLQVIFIAVLLGIAAGLAGEYSTPLRAFFETGNALFLKATTLIVKAIPLMVFCSVSSMVLTTGLETLSFTIGFLMLNLFATVCMVAAYCIMLLTMARLNPLVFLKKTGNAVLTAFSLCSSNAAMPVTMKCCTEKLGISNKVTSFSIPLGSTIHMDGMSGYFAMASIFLADIYGVSLTGSVLASLVFSIMALSIGAPGIPGVRMVCLSVLLLQIGVPVEAINIIIGVDALTDMYSTAANVLGDITGSLIVAKQQNLLDKDVFYSK